MQLEGPPTVDQEMDVEETETLNRQLEELLPAALPAAVTGDGIVPQPDPLQLVVELPCAFDSSPPNLVLQPSQQGYKDEGQIVVLVEVVPVCQEANWNRKRVELHDDSPIETVTVSNPQPSQSHRNDKTIQTMRKNGW